jgi:hypothetical protein
LRFGLSAALVASACATPAPSLENPAAPRVSSTVAPASQPTEPAASVALSAKPRAASAPPTPPTLLITDPAVLTELERQGLGLGALFGDASAVTNERLATLPSFAPLVAEVERELRLAARDKLAGVDVARFSHRLFDRRFLRLPQARFALAGVVNRPDRAPFAPSSCGETRLIYRLTYALDGERASKLPMTVGVELQVPRDSEGCRAAAARWLEPASENATSQARASWLRSPQGPLAASRVALAAGAGRVVVNLQMVRWPSTVRPDLGGHAEYLLRSFRLAQGAALQPEPLENTPRADVLQNAQGRARLLDFLAAESSAVDAGLATLPESLAAHRAVSVTPRGLHRLANRPFAQAVRTHELQSLGLAGGRFVRSPAGLLRRLDQLSCPGCHQARSVAGFHLLGEDASDAPAENALAVPVSPHVLADLPRRKRIAESMLAGEAPDFSAPLAEHADSRGAYGQACALRDDASFEDWKCGAGLVCSALEAGADDLIGQCAPAVQQVGDGCEEGSVTPTPNPLRDRVRGVNVKACPDMVCNRSAVGFPGGMCTAGCDAPGATCGAIALLDPFNACLARGASFLSCIRGNVQPAGLRACDAQTPCRDDYVCARAARGGVCLPPYFVFQLRVDGHSNGLH